MAEERFRTKIEKHKMAPRLERILFWRANCEKLSEFLWEHPCCLHLWNASLVHALQMDDDSMPTWNCVYLSPCIAYERAGERTNDWATEYRRSRFAKTGLKLSTGLFAATTTIVRIEKSGVCFQRVCCSSKRTVFVRTYVCAAECINRKGARSSSSDLSCRSANGTLRRIACVFSTYA